MLERKDRLVSSLAPEVVAKWTFWYQYHESTSTLLQIEHILLGKISGDDRDEGFSKAVLKSATTKSTEFG